MPILAIFRACLLATIVFTAALAPVRAQDGWLDDPLVPWNQPGMAIPSVPVNGVGAIDSMCIPSIRTPETPADAAIVQQGWSLFGSYHGGWGLLVIGATAGFDGMCRPMGYQYFIFSEGRFAGTLSPVDMASRTTGAGRVLSIDSERRVMANFTRYSASDPLCCPSRPGLAVELRVQESPAGPALIPERVFEFN
jgi:hypothetical protein